MEIKLTKTDSPPHRWLRKSCVVVNQEAVEAQTG
jgi:hypothetical protein